MRYYFKLLSYFLQREGFFQNRPQKPTLHYSKFVSERIQLNEAGYGNAEAELLWIFKGVDSSVLLLVSNIENG